MQFAPTTMWRAAPTLSILLACRDRDTSLNVTATALQSVASQVVVVDWSSAKPPVVLPLRDPRLVVVKVEQESGWHLSRAYNVGMTFVSSDIVWKIDCDTHIDINAVPFVMALPRRTFFTGDWRNKGNAAHLNGNLAVWRKEFWKAGGYDERIQSYGHDDSALYKQLKKRGNRWRRIQPWWASHLHHGDDKRITDDAMASIRRNCLCERAAAPWVTVTRSQYEHVGNNTLIATYVPDDICNGINITLSEHTAPC